MTGTSAPGADSPNSLSPVSSPSPISAGTVLITGPTGGLGHSATMALARRPAGQRPDLLLVGRPGQSLDAVAAEARAAGATVREVGCDLASLASVRAAGAEVREILASSAVRPLRGLVANAGLSGTDTRKASADGFELTFAVNYLAHVQLIGDLLDSFSTPARIVLLGSNTYYTNWVRRIMQVAPAKWADPFELARPAGPDVQPSIQTGGFAYSNSKLAILYYAHELQRRVRDGINVAVFEPGFMPGTGLGRQAGPTVMRIGRGIQRLPIPGVSSPAKSGPALASVAVDDRWAHLRGGAFVLIDSERDVQPIAHDPARERELWDATTKLLAQTASALRPDRGPHGRRSLNGGAWLWTPFVHRHQAGFDQAGASEEPSHLIAAGPGGLLLSLVVPGIADALHRPLVKELAVHRVLSVRASTMYR